VAVFSMVRAWLLVTPARRAFPSSDTVCGHGGRDRMIYDRDF